MVAFVCVGGCMAGSAALSAQLAQKAACYTAAVGAELCYIRPPASANTPTHPLPLPTCLRSYPEVCFRLQQALPDAVGCYRMAHLEEEGPAAVDEDPPGAPAAEPASGSAAGTGGGPTAAPAAGGSSAEATDAGPPHAHSGCTAHGDGDVGDSAAPQQEEGEEERQLEQLQQRYQQAALGRIVFLYRVVEGVAPASFGG